jgi:flagellar motor switch protein FliG
MARPKKSEKLGVKIVVEITGHMQKGEMEEFMAALSSVVDNKLENGGNGGN